MAALFQIATDFDSKVKEVIRLLEICCVMFSALKSNRVVSFSMFDLYSLQ